MLGVVTISFLTDWPSQAGWLPDRERDWLTAQLELELRSKKQLRDHTIRQAFSDKQVLLILGAWVFALLGSLGNLYWVPTFLKRLPEFSNRDITYMLMVPSLVGIAGILFNGWHSDKTRERHWHAAIPLIVSGSFFAFVIAVHSQGALAIVFLLLGTSAYYACLPVFWAIPTLILSETAAAASLGLINTFGQAGGFVGPYIIGYLNDRTRVLTASIAFIATAYFVSATLILSLRKDKENTTTAKSALILWRRRNPVWIW